MKFPGRIYFKIILKVAKTQGFTISLEDKFRQKPLGDHIDPPSHFRVKNARFLGVIEISCTTQVVQLKLLIKDKLLDFVLQH